MRVPLMVTVALGDTIPVTGISGVLTTVLSSGDSTIKNRLAGSGVGVDVGFGVGVGVGDGVGVAVAVGLGVGVGVGVAVGFGVGVGVGAGVGVGVAVGMGVGVAVWVGMICTVGVGVGGGVGVGVGSFLPQPTTVKTITNARVIDAQKTLFVSDIFTLFASMRRLGFML